MNNWWFVADTHFGHAGIMKHCGREFTNVSYMDEKLISNWNNSVMPKDVVVHAGDFCLGLKKEAEYYFKRLHGNKILLKGNHDHWMNEKRYEYHKKIDDVFLYVTHYPLRSWPRAITNGWNLHGHCHGNLEPLFYNQLDISVDRAYEYLGEYRPFSFAEVGEWIAKQNKLTVSSNDSNSIDYKKYWKQAGNLCEY
jgi:calcineurin-like phosphoesterase family protein